MATTSHMATAEDDARHTPGPDSLPLWNESLWFPFYDPASEVGVVLRAGIHANLGEANLFLFLTHRGKVVHSLIDHRLPVPPVERSEEHTSELQSLTNLVCRLLLEKKKKNK